MNICQPRPRVRFIVEHHIQTTCTLRQHDQEVHRPGACGRPLCSWLRPPLALTMLMPAIAPTVPSRFRSRFFGLFPFRAKRGGINLYERVLPFSFRTPSHLRQKLPRNFFLNPVGAPDLPLFHYAQTTQSGGGVSLFGPPPVFFGPPFCVATETGLEALR